MSVKLKRTFVLFGAAAVLASCVDDLGIGAPKESKLDQVYFTASIAEQDFFGTKKAQTRSAADERQRVQAGFYDLAIDGRSDIRLSVSTLDGMFGKSVPMPEEGKIKATTRGVMLTELAQKPMTVIEYAKTSDDKTVVGEPYTAYTEDGATWGGSHIQQNGNTVSRTLHALYPSSKSYTIDPKSHTFSYTTPFIAEDQSDLLYADAEHGLGTEAKDSVHLTFDHLLTAVRFKIGSQQLPMSVIRNIAIDGIVTTGTYNFQTKRWELSKDLSRVMCNLNFNATGVENTIINGGESTFMLLPQQLTPNAKLTIYYEDYTEGDDASNGVKTLTATLATANTPAWGAGQCITYTLMDHEADNEYILDVEAPKDFTAAGGEQPVNVLSYRQAEGVRTPMKWIVQSYSSDGGNTWMSGGATNVPKGMSISPTEGMSKDTIMSINVSLNAADSVLAPHRDFLRYKAPLGHNGEAFDLSRHDYLNAPCAQTTANCYVVDAPGKYRIPTAYGNAIVDGKTNKDAYTDKAGYRNCETKNNFMTHNGKAITAPMIKNNGINLSHASLVWEDVDELIDHNSIKLVDDGNAIEFEILPDNIDQGNAVIAVMDGNNVAWSWHIWVTDEKATLAEPIEDANKYGEQVDFMPLTLGWCSSAKASGQIGREAAVRITMPEHLSKQACIRIRQNSTSSRDTYENTVGNATYYNWGRKDPFPGAISTDMPIESNENAKSLPKPFYQAGADAAALGLHAELHTEYSTNIRDLLLQGALVGLDGFLVGKTIADIRNILKNQEFYANAQELAGHKVTISEESVWTKTRSYIPKSPNDIAAINEMIDAGEVKEIFKELAPGTVSHQVLPASSETGLSVIYKNADGLPTNIVKITKGAQSVHPVTHKIVYTYIYKMYSVKVLDPVASIWLGDFSGAILTATGQALKSSFDLGKILSSTSLFSGSTDWCREISSHGVGINYGIQHPNILLRDPISWINYDYVGNLWNVNQTSYDEKDIIVCKSIYDPCPAGYCVPTARDMSGIDDKQTIISHFGATAKTSSLSDGVVRFPAVGCRNFWAGAEPGSAVTNNINDLIFLNGEQGMYWTSSPAINLKEDGEKGAYVINFRGTDSYNDCGEQGVKYTPRVVNDMKLQQSYALPIRPVREKQSQKYNEEIPYF